MSKVVKNSTNLNLPEIKKDLDNKVRARESFVPSPSQRQAKSRFWRA
jgi:hypothetical protein